MIQSNNEPVVLVLKANSTLRPNERRVEKGICCFIVCKFIQNSSSFSFHRLLLERALQWNEKENLFAFKFNTIKHVKWEFFACRQTMKFNPILGHCKFCFSSRHFTTYRKLYLTLSLCPARSLSFVLKSTKMGYKILIKILTWQIKLLKNIVILKTFCPLDRKNLSPKLMCSSCLWCDSLVDV